MATEYDEWLTSAPDDTEGEWVAERAEELAQDMAADENVITEVLDNACGFTDYSETFTADLAKFFIAFDKAADNDAAAAAGCDLWTAMLPHIKAHLESESRTKAQAEWDNRLTGPEDLE
jgi:hypothetical protein